MVQANTEQIKKDELKFSEFFQVDTKQIAALLIKGHTYYAQGQLEEAKKIFERLAVLDGNNAYVHGILGSIYQQEERWDAAIARYTMALINYPQDINSLNNRGEIYLRLGKFKEAVDDFNKAIALDPSHKHPSANRARMFIAITQEALKLLQQKEVKA